MTHSDKDPGIHHRKNLMGPKSGREEVPQPGNEPPPFKLFLIVYVINCLES
jgi:hypothetical protein